MQAGFEFHVQDVMHKALASEARKADEFLRGDADAEMSFAAGARTRMALMAVAFVLDRDRRAGEALTQYIFD